MAKKKSARKTNRVAKKKENKFDKYLFLSWRNILIIIIAWFASIILHNVFYAIFGIEEAVFFVVAVIAIPVYFVISFIYSLVRILQGKNKITARLIISILIGLVGGFVVIYFGYFRGPWFFALISLFIAFVVYRIIQFIFKKF